MGISLTPAQSGRQARGEIAEAVSQTLEDLPQKNAVAAEDRARWTENTVESAMRMVRETARLPAADPASQWDGAPPAERLEARRLIAGEVTVLTHFRPAEMALIGAENAEDGPGPAARTAVLRRLCRMPPAGVTEAGWRALSRRRLMRSAWRGGTGLSADGGWEVDSAALRDLSRGGGHPEDPWLPGLLRAPRRGRPLPRPRPAGAAAGGRLVLAEYVWPGRDRASVCRAGAASLAELTLLSLQLMCCVRAGVRPDQCGFAVFDMESCVWSWTGAGPLRSLADAAEKACDRLWNSCVLTGRPPAGAPEPEAAAGSGALAGDIARCWAAALLARAAKDESERRRASLKRRLGTPVRAAAVTAEAGELCVAVAAPVWEAGSLEAPLRQVGLDRAEFADGEKRLDAPRAAEALLAAGTPPEALAPRWDLRISGGDGAAAEKVRAEVETAAASAAEEAGAAAARVLGAEPEASGGAGRPGPLAGARAAAPAEEAAAAGAGPDGREAGGDGDRSAP